MSRTRCSFAGSMLAGLLAAFATTATTAAPAQELLRASLADCRARLDPELDVGFERIAAKCPTLPGVLERSEWAAWLPRSWRDPHNELSAGSLAELGALIDGEQRVAPLRQAPARADLAPVLAQLATEARATLATRLSEWLRAMFERDHTPGEEDWLASLLRRMDGSEALVRLVGYAAIALVVALALLIVVSELRAMGLLRARRDTQSTSRDNRHPGAIRAVRRELGHAPLLERPALLLEAIVDALVEARRLPPAGNLTARELTARATLPEPGQRERFAALADAAERTRFGPQPPTEARLIDALEGGGMLLASLGPQRS